MLVHPDWKCAAAERHQKPLELPTENKNKNFDDVEILCLGHSQAQFNSIEDRPYLKKINLNKIYDGKYSDNHWAESRIFLANNVFSDNSKIIGYTSASWNIKYNSSRIDDFHNWPDAITLINSKPKDKIMICGHVLCTCSWASGRVFYDLFKKDCYGFTKKFLNLMNITNLDHSYVAHSNNWITHKENIECYGDYLKNNNIYEKIDYFVEKYKEDFREDFFKKRYNGILDSTRVHGYFMELVGCFWLKEQNFTYLPQYYGNLDDWYSVASIKSREKKI